MNPTIRWLILLLLLLLAACAPLSVPSPTAAPMAAASVTPAPPDWFSISLTDVTSGDSFAVADFAGKVVLVETMAEWCPNCEYQAEQVKKLYTLLDRPEDLISISLDTDLHEDAASLKAYAAERGYAWYFAIAPLELDRALGNLYGAQFMNPPLAPMLFIDRQGAVYTLPFGAKSADALHKTLEPYLAP